MNLNVIHRAPYIHLIYRKVELDLFCMNFGSYNLLIWLPRTTDNSLYFPQTLGITDFQRRL